MKNQEIIELIMSIALFIISIGFIIGLIFILSLVVMAFIHDIKNRNRYKKSVISILIAAKKNNDDDIMKSIDIAFELYWQKGYSYLNYFGINSELVSDLNSLSYKKYYKQNINNPGSIAGYLERIITKKNESLVYNDKELNDIVDSIVKIGKTDKDIIRTTEIASDVKTYFKVVLAHCNGMISVHENNLIRANFEIKKIKKARVTGSIVGAVGLVSGIITIFAALFKII